MASPDAYAKQFTTVTDCDLLEPIKLYAVVSFGYSPLRDLWSLGDLTHKGEEDSKTFSSIQSKTSLIEWHFQTSSLTKAEKEASVAQG